MSVPLNDDSIHLLKLFINMISADDKDSTDLQKYYISEDRSGFGLEPSFLEAYINVLNHINQHLSSSHALKQRIVQELQRVEKVYFYTQLKYNLHNLKRDMIQCLNENNTDKNSLPQYANKKEALSNNLIRLQDQIFNDIQNDQEITYPAGWMGSDEVGGHSLYVSIKKSKNSKFTTANSMSYRVRIFNLGEGVELFQQVYSLKDTVGYFHANILGKENLQKYIKGLIENDFKGVTKDKVEKAKEFLYHNNDRLYIPDSFKPQQKHTEDIQDIGNCIVKNYFFSTRNAVPHTPEAEQQYRSLFLHILGVTIAKLNIATQQKKEYSKYLKRVCYFIKETQTSFRDYSLPQIEQQLDAMQKAYQVPNIMINKDAVLLPNVKAVEQKPRSIDLTTFIIVGGALLSVLSSIVIFSRSIQDACRNTLNSIGINFIAKHCKELAITSSILSITATVAASIIAYSCHTDNKSKQKTNILTEL